MKNSLSLCSAILIAGILTGFTVAHATPPPPAPLAGEVVETMDSGGYTYLLVQQANEKIWGATKPTKVAVGDKVRVIDGMPMQDFESRTLQRKFDRILFASGVEVNGQSAPALPAGHPPLSDAATKPIASKTAIEVKPGTVEKVAGGYTVAECFAQKKKLAGKTVKVRGVVVKFAAEIMGKNWVHLRDGTGEAGSNDLTATTSATVKPGDTVIVEGKLSADKDLGAGYKYAVLLEDAVILKP